MKRLPTFISKIIVTCCSLILAWIVIAKVSTAQHDEDVIASMSQETYDQIVDTLTVDGNKPSEHQIVTYYYERNK